MKQLLLTIYLLGINFAYCQVGVNTITPKATLEVVGKPSTATAADGVIAPRMTRAELIAKTAYTTDQIGAIVYVTDLSGTNTAPTLNINNIGYYYFDGTIWQALDGNKFSYGDVKTGIQTADHNGWIKLDGRATSTLTSTQQTQATALGIGANLPDATNTYLVQNGTTLGSVSGSNTKTIVQANLPSVDLTASNVSAGTPSGTVSVSSNSAGTPSGSISVANQNTGDQWLSEIINYGGGGLYYAVDRVKSRGSSGWFGRVTNGFDDDPNDYYSTYTETAHNHTATFTGLDLGNHTHTGSFAGLALGTHSHEVPLGGSGTALDITPKSLSVNTFIYLGN